MLSERPWRWELVVPFGFWLLALNFAVGTLMTAWLASPYTPLHLRPESITILAGTVCFHGVAFVLVCWLIRAHQLTFAAAFGFSRSRLWRSLTLGIVGTLLAMPVVFALGFLWSQFLQVLHVQIETQLPIQMLQDSSSMEVRVLIGVIAILIAPVVEEMVFRGILYATLKRYGFRQVAVWGTALLFAAVHSNRMTFVPLVALAVVLAWLYEATDDLLSAIIAHSFFNLINFLLVSVWKFG